MLTRLQKVFMMTFAMLLLAGLTAYGQNDVTKFDDPIQGVPNDGDWPGNEDPPNAIDDDSGTKFLHYKGETQATGIAVTPAAGTIVGGITLTTANDAVERDPASYELWGSNTSITGPDWTLIASGDLSLSNNRLTKSDPIVFTNTTAYDHYKLIFPTVKDSGSANSMQIAEIELLGYPPNGWPPQIDPGADQSVVLPNNSAVLNGTVYDEGKPLPTNPGDPDPDDPNKLRWHWTVVSVPPGSGGVQWAGNPNSGEAFTYEGSPNPPDTVFTCNPTAIFDVEGQYVLRFNASDGDKDANDTMTVRVWPVGYIGQIMYYKFDGDPNDSSLSGRHGVLQNGAKIVVDDVRSSVLELDGANDFMDLVNPQTAADLGIDGNKPRSMTTWVYTRSFNDGGIFDVGAHSDGQNFCLRTLADPCSWRIQYNGGSYDIDFTCESLNKWVHFALVHDGEYTRMYVNGKLKTQAPRVLNTAGGDTFRIGQYGDNEFNGRIDDFALWDYALSPEEIRSLMPAGDYNADRSVNVLDLKFLTDDWLTENSTPILPSEILDNMETYQPGGIWPVPGIFSWFQYYNEDCLASSGTASILLEPNEIPQGDQALRIAFNYPDTCDGGGDWVVEGKFLKVPPDNWVYLAQYDEIRFWKRNFGAGHEDISWAVGLGSNAPGGTIEDEHLVCSIGPFSSTEDPNEWHEVVVDLRNGDNVAWESPYSSVDDVIYVHGILITAISDVGSGESGAITVDVDDFRLLDYTPGCSAMPVADLDGNCILDLRDYAILGANFLKDPGL